MMIVVKIGFNSPWELLLRHPPSTTTTTTVTTVWKKYIILLLRKNSDFGIEECYFAITCVKNHHNKKIKQYCFDIFI